MSIKYYVREIGDPREKPEKGKQRTKRYMAQIISDGMVDEQPIIDRIVEKSALSEGDVLSCITELFKEVMAELLEGHSVKLSNFGTFLLTMQSKIKDTPEEVTNETIKNVHISFRPSTRWYERYKPNVRYTRVATPQRKGSKPAPPEDTGE